MQNNFLLLGRHKDAQNYLKAFDVYAISSTKEGVPYSLLEAMKSGVSIVTTNVGGIPEVITNEESGLLVNPQDGVELASNIKVLIEHEEYSKQLAEKAKQKLIENFSKDKSIEKTFSIY